MIKEPKKIKEEQLSRDFDFIGYDLLEKDGNISALTNCGGFDETFKPEEQNKYGLITQYERAKEIQLMLPKNNPNEDHAYCQLFEVWRHKFIGRNGSFNKEFCVNLEYHLCETFRKSTNNEVKNFWCDGILYKKLSKKSVNDKRKLETTAWIGKNGQIKYKMIIYMGERSLRRFAKGTSMNDCVPNSDTTEWIDIDLNNNRNDKF